MVSKLTQQIQTKLHIKEKFEKFSKKNEQSDESQNHEIKVCNLN